MTDWQEATRRLAAGEATLLSLWGEPGRVHMAVLDNGASLLARRWSDGSCAGLTFTHCSLGYEILMTPLPVAYTVLGSFGSGSTVPHSQPFTGFQSSGVIAPRLPRTRVRTAPASCCDA